VVVAFVAWAASEVDDRHGQQELGVNIENWLATEPAEIFEISHAPQIP